MNFLKITKTLTLLALLSVAFSASAIQTVEDLDFESSMFIVGKVEEVSLYDSICEAAHEMVTTWPLFNGAKVEFIKKEKTIHLGRGKSKKKTIIQNLELSSPIPIPTTTVLVHQHNGKVVVNDLEVTRLEDAKGILEKALIKITKYNTSFLENFLYLTMKLKEFNVPGFYYEARLAYENDLAQIVIVERGGRNDEKKFVFLEEYAIDSDDLVFVATKETFARPTDFVTFRRQVLLVNLKKSMGDHFKLNFCAVKTPQVAEVEQALVEESAQEEAKIEEKNTQEVITQEEVAPPLEGSYFSGFLRRFLG
jgi:hypothetical protein